MLTNLSLTGYDWGALRKELTPQHNENRYFPHLKKARHVSDSFPCHYLMRAH